MDDLAKKDKEELIVGYQHFVHQVVGSLIKKMNLPSQMFDDYVSAGYVGLVEAASRFDFSQGKSFKNYAYLRIKGSIIDSIRKGADIPGYVYHKYVKALKAAQALREAIYEQESLGKQRPSDREMLAGVFEYLSLSALAFRISERDAQVELAKVEDLTLNPGNLLETQRNTKLLQAMIGELPEKERRVIIEYYFEEKTFSDIACALGDVSKSWVSRLHARALKILRNKYCESL